MAEGDAAAANDETRQRKWETNMRQLFILFALVFALVTTAAATVVTSDVISDSAIAQQPSR